MKMVGKTVLALVFFLVLIITYSIFIGTVDLRSHFFPLLQSQLNDNIPCRTQSPLRVYMYDLPRRFNVGMINPRSSDETPVIARTLPPWPANSGLKLQHSVEYWMMASLLYEGDGENETREAVRVSDPDSADVFFVPFFSSLSFDTHGHTMTDPDTEFDRQLQVDILKFLRQSNYWQRSSGRDHVIPMHHPNAFRFLREQVNASILIVADFGRYSKIMSNLSKDVVAPYAHVMDSFVDDDPPDPYESRTTLLFFQGRTVRKDEGKVRAKLAKILVGYEDVHYEQSFATGESIKASSQGMRSSKFCLHPAGDTPSSCRLFDAIVSHCVPVIVSDKIELPYEDEIDYTQFSIFFSVKEALVPGYMVTYLRQIPKERWLEMWRQLKKISHHYEFQYPPKKEDAVNMLWRQVRRKLPMAKLAVHRSRRLKVPDWWR
uniref:Putative arabinosyltransferase ARAD1 n=1 Tax=Davidia involucrata TaxID=16924 RepID=A0A5B6ZHQ2_DAVIN